MTYQARRLLVCLLLPVLAASLPAQVANIWTNTLGGYWETPVNWSAGAPSSSQSVLLITNALTKTVRLYDGGVPDSVRTISNLVVSAPTGYANTLQLDTLSSGTNQLEVLNGLTVNRGGEVLFASSITGRMDGISGGGLDVDGSMRVLAGLLVTSNTFSHIGSSAQGALTINGGAWRAREVALGYLLGASGTLTQASGSTFLSGELRIGPANSSTGAVYLTGGQLTVASANTYVGLYANSLGAFSASNAFWQARDVYVGYYGNSQGKLTVSGGTNVLSGSLTVSDSAGANGTVSLTGGQLFVTNAAGNARTTIGNSGLATMTASNCLWQGQDAYVGRNAGSFATLNLYGGTNLFSTGLTIGDSLNATGRVFVLGGSLLVTNAAGNAKLTVGRDGYGTFSLQGATVVADQLIATNNYAHSSFSILNGSLTTRSTVASNAFSMDGGTWDMLGGSHQLSSVDFPTGFAVSDATVRVRDAQLSGRFQLGGYLDATLLVSNVNWVDGSVVVGSIGSQGANALTLFDSVTTLSSLLAGEDGPNNTVLVSGGQLNLGGLSLAAANGAWASATFSNTTWQAGSVSLGQPSALMGVLTLYGSTGLVTNSLLVGTIGSFVAGRVILPDGWLRVTNASGSARLQLGSGGMAGMQGPSELYLQGGTLIADQLMVTNYYSNPGQAQARVRFQGGTLSTRGAVVHNGYDVTLGASNYPPATWLMHDGIHKIESYVLPFSGDQPMALRLGAAPASTGIVSVANATLLTTNVQTYVGDAGLGQVIISNSTWLANGVVVGCSNGASGTLNIYSGNVGISTNLTLGYWGCGATGAVRLTGGLLLVTNATHDATLEVRSGAFTLSNGLVVVDRLVVTNACARFMRYGGTLQYRQVVLDPNLNANGDGIPNGWKLQYGFDPFLWNVASLDPDGDGMSNLQEYLAGTNPTNAASVLRILSVRRANNDVEVVWKGAGPRSVCLQAVTGSRGGFTNAFADIRTNLLNLPQDYRVTNWDIGGGTQTGRYYRLRVPFSP